MTERVVGFLLLITLLCATSFTALNGADTGKTDTKSAQKKVTLIQPFDKGVYTEEYISVTFVVDPIEVDSVKLFSSENERAIIRMEEDRDAYHYLFRFSFGEHSIRAEAFKDGRIVGKDRVKIYRKAFLSKYYRVIPAGYEVKFFHTDRMEKKCEMCHDMSVNEEEGVAFYDVSESNCFDCHQSLLYKKFAHAPTVNFVCLPCHTGKTGEKNRKYRGKSKFLYPDPIGDTCFKCHKKSRKKWMARRSMHDPVGAGKCNLCHNPHSSDINKNFLRNEVWTLCTSCHTDKRSKQSYVTLFKYRQKGGAGVERSLLEGDFDCITCHNPHASDRSYLIRQEYNGLENVCFTLSQEAKR